jgi:Lipocalin-like domain
MTATAHSPMRRDDVVGTWELTSYIQRGPSGSPVHPFGDDATGLLIYSADGYMSVQLMRAGRPPFDRPDTDGASVEQAVAAVAGYLGYCGPFDVDETSGALRHDVSVSLLPNWIDRPLLRDGVLEGNRLTLTGMSTGTDGTTIEATLVWTRTPQR